jgi:hypothetical protein
MRAVWPSLPLPPSVPVPKAGDITQRISEEAYRIGVENEYAAPIRQTETPTYPRPTSLTGRKKAVKINGIRPNDDTPALTGGTPVLERPKDVGMARFRAGRTEVIRGKPIRL